MSLHFFEPQTITFGSHQKCLECGRHITKSKGLLKKPKQVYQCHGCDIHLHNKCYLFVTFESARDQPFAAVSTPLLHSPSHNALSPKRVSRITKSRATRRAKPSPEKKTQEAFLATNSFNLKVSEDSTHESKSLENLEDSSSCAPTSGKEALKGSDEAESGKEEEKRNSESFWRNPESVKKEEEIVTKERSKSKELIGSPSARRSSISVIDSTTPGRKNFKLKKEKTGPAVKLEKLPLHSPDVGLGSGTLEEDLRKAPNWTGRQSARASLVKRASSKPNDSKRDTIKHLPSRKTRTEDKISAADKEKAILSRKRSVSLADIKRTKEFKEARSNITSRATKIEPQVKQVRRKAETPKKSYSLSTTPKVASKSPRHSKVATTKYEELFSDILKVIVVSNITEEELWSCTKNILPFFRHFGPDLVSVTRWEDTHVLFVLPEKMCKTKYFPYKVNRLMMISDLLDLIGKKHGLRGRDFKLVSFGGTRLNRSLTLSHYGLGSFFPYWRLKVEEILNEPEHDHEPVNSPLTKHRVLSPKARHKHKSPEIFGIQTLDDITYPKVEKLVLMCLDWFKSSSVHKNEGIFRKSGNEKRINEMQKSIEKQDVFFLENEDPHTMATLFKRIFHDMQEPLFTWHLYQQWIDADVPDEEERVKNIITLINSLPENNLKILKYSCEYLHEISREADISLMHSNNLGLVFAPNWIRPKSTEDSVRLISDGEHASSIVATMISQYPSIFASRHTLERHKTVYVSSRPNMSTDKQETPVKSVGETNRAIYPILLFFPKNRSGVSLQRIVSSSKATGDDILEKFFSEYKIELDPKKYDLETFNGEKIPMNQPIEELGLGVTLTKFHLQVKRRNRLVEDGLLDRQLSNLMGDPSGPLIGLARESLHLKYMIFNNNYDLMESQSILTEPINELL